MVRQWGVFEVSINASGVTAPFEVPLHATFVPLQRTLWLKGEANHSWSNGVRVRGFYDGNDVFLLRFCPPALGHWTFTTSSPVKRLDRIQGLLQVIPADTHGPVRAHGRHFRHADGTEHFSIGTTSYAWIHQNSSVRTATLNTMLQEGSAFNKLRFALFPKWFLYNHEEPSSGLYPYEGTPPANWNFRSFSPPFWRHLEGLIQQLGQVHTWKIIL